jgi:hypothetical protein
VLAGGAFPAISDPLAGRTLPAALCVPEGRALRSQLLRATRRRSTKTRATAAMLVGARMRWVTPATKMSKVGVPLQAAADVAAAQTLAEGRLEYVPCPARAPGRCPIATRGRARGRRSVSATLPMARGSRRYLGTAAALLRATTATAMTTTKATMTTMTTTATAMKTKLTTAAMAKMTTATAMYPHPLLNTVEQVGCSGGHAPPLHWYPPRSGGVSYVLSHARCASEVLPPMRKHMQGTCWSEPGSRHPRSSFKTADVQYT